MRRSRSSRAIDRHLKFVAALLTACGVGGVGEESTAESEPPSLLFDTTLVRVASASDTAVLRVELAVTDEQRTLGLMARSALPSDAGMLFLYDTAQPDSSGFWMFRTRIPLDIAFLDSTGTIRAIRSMAPCDSTYAASCPTYPAGVPYRAALEVNQGYFARQELGIGDRVLLEDVQRARWDSTRENPAPER